MWNSLLRVKPPSGERRGLTADVAGCPLQTPVSAGIGQAAGFLLQTHLPPITASATHQEPLEAGTGARATLGALSLAPRQANQSQCAFLLPACSSSSARRDAHGHTGAPGSAAHLPPRGEAEEQRAPRLGPEVLGLLHLGPPASGAPESQLREGVNFCSALFLEISSLLDGLSLQPGDKIQELWDPKRVTGFVVLCASCSVFPASFPEFSRILATALFFLLVY